MIGRLPHSRALNNPTGQQLDKAARLRVKIVDECRAQTLDCTSALPPVPPPPESASSRAAALNEQGKSLMFDGRFAAAEPLFAEAVRLDPDPRYLFNHGMNLFQETKFEDAIRVLEKLRTIAPTAEMLTKTEQLLDKVYAESKVVRAPYTGKK